MRVAWVTPYPPDRAGGGGHIRQAHLLTGLGQDHEITLVCPGQPQDRSVRRAVDAVVDVRPAGRTWLERGRAARRIGDLAGALVGRYPREERALAPLRAAIVPALAAIEADVVLVEFAGLAPLAWHPGLAPLRRSAQWLLTLHNLPSRMAAQHADVAPHRRQRWLFRREAHVAAAAEHLAVGRYDQIIVTSAEDLRCLPSDTRAEVIGNGVDLTTFTPTPLPDAPRMTFIGALYTTPNVDGAVWFCRSVLPQIRRARPDATIELVGARPTAEVLALAALPGVSVHPDVDDPGLHLRRARVAVVPLRIGSGTRLKAMEAWASGRPVVGTTIGLEGLGVVADRHALVADSAAGFAEAVLRLLRPSDALASRLALAGRALAEDRHGWPDAAARLRSLLVA